MGAGGSIPLVPECQTRSQWRAQFDAFKFSDKLLVIDFTATWCGPCKRMEPVIQDCAAKYNDVQFTKIDVDKLDDVARSFGVDTMPAYVFLKKGKEIDRVIGAQKDELERKIEKHRV
ncbi:hypothetical protein SLA2020_362560 [Shorea laevis]